MISTLCFLPPSAIPEFNLKSLIGLDKWVHLGIFLILSLLFLIPIKQVKNLSSAQLLLAFVLLSSYGILIEFIQGTAWINRSFEWADVLADAIGVVIGILILPWILRKLPLAKKYIPILNRFF